MPATTTTKELDLGPQERYRSSHYPILSHEERIIITNAFPSYSDLSALSHCRLPIEAIDALKTAKELVIPGTDPQQDFFYNFKVFHAHEAAGVIVGLHTPPSRRIAYPEAYLIHEWGDFSFRDLVLTALASLRAKLEEEVARDLAKLKSIGTFIQELKESQLTTRWCCNHNAVLELLRDSLLDRTA